MRHNFFFLEKRSWTLVPAKGALPQEIFVNSSISVLGSKVILFGGHYPRLGGFIKVAYRLRVFSCFVLVVISLCLTFLGFCFVLVVSLLTRSLLRYTGQMFYALTQVCILLSFRTVC